MGRGNLVEGYRRSLWLLRAGNTTKAFSVVTGTGNWKVINQSYSVCNNMISRFCFSLHKCSILSLPAWFFLLLAAPGSIWPSLPIHEFRVSISPIHIYKKANRLISENQFSTLGPVNPGCGPIWEPDFWEERREGSLRRGRGMGGTRTSLWDKWLLSGGMVVVEFLLPLLSDSSVRRSVPFVKTNNFLSKIQAATRSATGLNNRLQNMSPVLTIKPQL